MARWFQLKGRQGPWGDYGDILKNGMLRTHASDTESTRWDIARTGPYVPPMSFPWSAVLVTDEIRILLEHQKFTGLAFQPIAYCHVTRVDWQNWDQTAAEPFFYPEDGEPENYIDSMPHDAALVMDMPKLWQIDVVPTPQLQKQGSNTFYRNRHPKLDLAREFHTIWVSERFHDWTQAELGAWVDCVEVIPA